MGNRPGTEVLRRRRVPIELLDDITDIGYVDVSQLRRNGRNESYRVDQDCPRREDTLQEARASNQCHFYGTRWPQIYRHADNVGAEYGRSAA